MDLLLFQLRRFIQRCRHIRLYHFFIIGRCDFCLYILFRLCMYLLIFYLRLRFFRDSRYFFRFCLIDDWRRSIDSLVQMLSFRRICRLLLHRSLFPLLLCFLLNDHLLDDLKRFYHLRRELVDIFCRQFLALDDDMVVRILLFGVRFLCAFDLMLDCLLLNHELSTSIL